MRNRVRRFGKWVLKNVDKETISGIIVGGIVGQLLVYLVGFVGLFCFLLGLAVGIFAIILFRNQSHR